MSGRFPILVGLAESPANAAREGVGLMVVLAEAVIGFLAWLFGVMTDPVSLIRLALTVILSMLGLTVSYLLVEAAILASALGVPALFPVLAASLPGALAGYYWPWLP
jgi:hypothetical protein